MACIVETGMFIFISYFKLPDDTVNFLFYLLLHRQLFPYWYFLQLLGREKF